eukprot:SAG11_NODE_37610_length_256_cov_0.656051_1_plen_44_part_10
MAATAAAATAAADQDIALGGWNPMTQTRELLQKEGFAALCRRFP